MQFFITSNESSVREIASIVVATGCTYQVNDPVEPQETADDFAVNALRKSRAYARQAGGITISEHSGLIIPALGGLPGPWSARFSDCTIDWAADRVNVRAASNTPREQMDRLNNQRVLEMLKGVSQPLRAASFMFVVCVATPQGEILFKRVGESRGYVASDCRGSNGCGYDAIFIGNDSDDQTYAELDATRRLVCSHRQDVLDRLQAWLGQYVTQNAGQMGR